MPALFSYARRLFRVQHPSWEPTPRSRARARRQATSMICRHLSPKTPLGQQPKEGFTLIELLVVIAIIGGLLSIALPAVQAARHAARRTQCQNNLRQVGVALHSYHAARGHFPMGGLEWRPRASSKNRQLAWSAFLLPYLEQQSLYDSLDLATAFDSVENETGAAKIISIYVCPSSRRGARRVDGRGPCDYGGIYGERITSPNRPPKGTMLYDTAISIDHIQDGLSHTLIIAEDSRFDDGQWINGRNVFDQAYAINAAPEWENDIRSEHPQGGALVTRADGSVSFVGERTDLPVLAALCTRDGGDLAH